MVLQLVVRTDRRVVKQNADRYVKGRELVGN